MPSVKIEIKNLAQIRRAFGAAPKEMAKELEKAIAKSVFLIEAKAKPNTPVDTGRLKGSFYRQFGFLKGEIGTNTNYDIFVHEGTKFMRARPYLYNAVKDSDKEIQKFFTTAVQRVLDKIGQQV